MNKKDNIELELMEAFTSIKSDKDIGIPDIEQELAMIKEKHNKRIVFHTMRRIAASIAIILTLGGITLAAVNSDVIAQLFEAKDEHTSTSQSEPITSINNDLIILPSDTVTVQKGEVVFDDSSLSDIMMSISNNYSIPVEFNNKELKDVRLHFRYDTSDALDDVVKALNMFEKIKIRKINGKLEIE